MPLTTTEVPTYFGPSDSPLFGVVHLPVDHQIRGGVLICGSLGKEGMDSVRLQRTLADNLARSGVGVLRFDYLGLGDSAYAQVRDDAVANWVASVGHAVDYLTLIGAESVTAIGIRAGCLILNEHLAQPHRVNRVVYLDPAGTGRRYLREHTTLYRLSVGEDASTPGEVTLVGGRLSDYAATEFGALRISADLVSAHGVDNALLVGRPAETDKHITALASAEGVDSIIAGGLPECAHPRETLVPIPFAAVDSIVEWIDRNTPTPTHRATPQYLSTVTMPPEGPNGVDVVESIERIEPSGLFAIRAQRQPPGPAPAKTVLFFVTSNDSHVGPAREWVELSRRVAASGSQALRWDPAGLGLSGEVSKEWRSIYSKRDIKDSVAVARHSCDDTGTLELVGICSGSWYAAQTARGTGAKSAVLVNLMAWNWRVTHIMRWQWSIKQKTLHAVASGEAAADIYAAAPISEAGGKRLRAFLNPARERTKSSMHDHLPRFVLRMLSRVGLVCLPEDVLTTLAHRGTDVTVIASPEDAAQFTAKGGRAALERLRSTAHLPRLIATPTGDHAAHHPVILAAIRNAVLPAAAASVSEHNPSSVEIRRDRQQPKILPCPPWGVAAALRSTSRNVIG